MTRKSSSGIKIKYKKEKKSLILKSIALYKNLIKDLSENYLYSDKIKNEYINDVNTEINELFKLYKIVKE